LLRTNRHLNIQDYFKQASTQGAALQLRRSVPVATEPAQGEFSRTLDAAHSAMQKRRQGLSIQDYFNHPVPTQRFVRAPLAPNGSATAQAPGVTESREAASLVAPIPSTPAQKHSPARLSETERINAGIGKAAAKYDLAPGLIQAVIRAESNYQVRAVSLAGAQGLMQLMPATAKELGVDNPFDIEQNIDGGAQYLRSMLDRFNGNLELALSAYNAGPGNVAKYNGRVPFAETRTYVARVLRFADQLSADTVKI
jgi:soluble lytic murein transglycosylase-like protein